MTLATVLIFVALAASILALLRGKVRRWSVVAIVASGIEAAYALGLVSVAIQGVPLALILAGVLTAAGVLIWLRSSSKPQVTAATIIALVGAVQVATLL